MKNNHLLQSPNDHNIYQPLTLDNGLRVLLVQQEDAEKSAAAVAVNVGHFDDPADREGLAHFLEHLVFLGSKQYPTAGEYAQFMASHGGSHNAWTGTEHSCFFFDIDDAALPEALHRFADFLSAPLFATDAVEKERHAIEAEFSMKLKDDGRRIYQAHKETVNPAHPFAKFSVGNLSTLDDRPHQSAQQAVQEFYQSQYAASRMTLCMVSALPVSEQERLVRQAFANLPTHLPIKPPLQIPLYLAEHQGICLNIQPHKPSQRLVLSFALPDIHPWYRFKIVSFVAHLLGDEGPGSLLSSLKQQGLVNSLSAGGGIDGSNYKDFSLAFDLTAHGLDGVMTILEACFGYFSLLRASPFPAQQFQERQRLVQWSYLYQEPRSTQQFASDLAVNMQHYTIEDYLFGDYRMEEPPQSLYRQLLGYFRADNLRLMLIAPEVEVDQQARWYHTPYGVDQLPPELLAQLAACQPQPQMQLPAPNPYIVGHLNLLPVQKHQQVPELLHDSTSLRIWYKADTEFHSPKGHVFVQLTLPISIQSRSSLAQTKLWLELLLDAVNERLYAATTAGLSYNLYVQQHGITLHTSGLSSNQIALVHDLLEQVQHCQIAEHRFAELKYQLCRHWHNQARNKPVSMLFNTLSSMLQPLNPDGPQLAAELEAIEFQSFTQFTKSLFQQVHIEAMMLGNWQKAEASSLRASLTKWQQQVQSVGERLPKQSFNLNGLGPVWLEHPIDGDDQALVIYLPAQQRTPHDMALFMLANHMISPEYFHALRTEQQLGYLVGTGYVPMNLKPGLAFYIQSPKTAAADLYYATLMFYRKFLEELPELTADEFFQYKDSLAGQIREKDTSLASRAKRIWLAIGQDDPACTLSQQITNELETLTLAEFYQFCLTLLAPDYDAVFLATGPAPQHSHMRSMSREQVIEELSGRNTWL